MAHGFEKVCAIILDSRGWKPRKKFSRSYLQREKRQMETKSMGCHCRQNSAIVTSVNGASNFVYSAFVFINGASVFVSGASNFVYGAFVFINGAFLFVNGAFNFVNGAPIFFIVF